MKKTIILLFLFIGVKGFCQKIDNNFIQGSWKVVEVEKYPTARNYKDLIDAFKKSTFIFQLDKSFILRTTNSNVLFEMMTDMFKDTSWKIGNKNNILIGTKKDGFTVMDMKINIIEKKVSFVLSKAKGVELVFQVKKQ